MTSGKDTIGMIGVGLMGHGIASNILKHGYPLVQHEHSGNQPHDGPLAAGPAKVASPAQVARAATGTITDATRTPLLEESMPRPHGVQQGFRPGPPPPARHPPTP